MSSGKEEKDVVPVMIYAHRDDDLLIAVLDDLNVVVGRPSLVGWRWDVPGAVCFTLGEDDYQSRYVTIISKGIGFDLRGRIDEEFEKQARLIMDAAMEATIDVLAQLQRKINAPFN